MRKRKHNSFSRAGKWLCLMLVVLLMTNIIPIYGTFATAETEGQQSTAEITGETQVAPTIENTPAQSEESETTSSPEPEGFASSAAPSAEPEESTEPEAMPEPSSEPAETIYENSISGMLWLDMYDDTANSLYAGDGIRQSEEQPLSGYKVELFKADDLSVAVQTVNTDADGKYSFENLESGSYIVGVKTETVGGVEYLLPFWYLDGTEGDNRFAAMYDEDADSYLYAYTNPIEIDVNSEIKDMDAGMRTVPEAQPMAGSYQVRVNSATGTVVGTYTSLSDAVNAVNTNGNTTFYILVLADDAGMGSVVTINANKNVTLTSSGGPYTITQGGTSRHITVNGRLTLENITLFGRATPSPSSGGGIQVNSGGTLIMNAGSVVQNCHSVSGGGVYNAGTFTMNTGSKLSSNLASGAQGGGGVQNTGTFTMNTGAEISGNTSSSNGGGVFNNGTSANFTMADGTISGNTAVYNGGAVNNNGSTFSMSGGKITGSNTANNGGGVYNSGTFNMSAPAEISGNTAQGSGGGVRTSGTFTMHDGKITGTNAAVNGGGVYNSGTFTMDDGEISGNTAKYGGGLYNTMQFYMYNNSSISGNTADTDGGGVWSDNLIIMNNSSSISSNNAGNNGGGIYSADYDYSNPASVTAYANIHIDSTATVSGNTASVTSPVPINYLAFTTRATNSFDGLLLNNDQINYTSPYTITYKANNGTSEPDYVVATSVSIGTSGTATTAAVAAAGFTAPAITPRFLGWNTAANGSGTAYTENDVITISSDVILYAQWSPERYLVYKDTDLATLLSSHHWIADAVAACGTTDGYTIVATEHDTAMATSLVIIPSNKSITLTSDAGGPYTITQAIINRHFSIYGSLTLENVTLSGGTTPKPTIGGGGIHVATGGSFTMNTGSVIQNCCGCGVDNYGTFTMTAGTISGNATAGDGSGVFNSFGGTFTMSGGEITGNATTHYGGGVISYSTFTMSGGKITGNTAVSGGGVYIGNGTFTMSGTAEISGNTATSTTAHGGGGVYLYGGTFTMNTGAQISGNNAQNGAGVWTGVTFTMNGGTVSGNTATQYGAGVHNTGTFTMNSGEVSGNTAGSQGGGVWNNGTFDMKGGKITGTNTATIGGGVINWSMFTMYAGAEISGNTATANGGGVFNSNNGTFDMQGGTISGNGAQSGGGVANYEQFTMSGGTISSNTATNNGGGVFVGDGALWGNSGGTFTMSGTAEISGNTATQSGGGVHNANTFNMSSTAEISGNTASQNGGGVYNTGPSAVFTMTGGKITGGNTASQNGGGVFNTNSGVLTMTGGEVSGNTANYGGGVANYATFTMSSGKINGNTAVNDSGGVFNFGTFTMSGTAQISSNTAKNGGGLFSSGQFDMSGTAQISGNTATVDGGGIYTSDYDYANPANTAKYANISIAATANVSGNTSSATSVPPTNHAAFTTRATNSFNGLLLNNDQINYRNPYYTITYKANNGTTEPDYTQVTTVATGLSGTAPAMTRATAGFSAPAITPRFMGWNTQANGGGTSYAEGALVPVSSNVTLYAQWAPERYLVYKDTDMSTLLSSHHWIADAVTACGTSGGYTIIATENDTAMATTVVTIPSNKSITLTSDAGGPYTITQTTAGARHFDAQGSLTLEDVTLSGGTTPNPTSGGGGIQVSSGGSLTMKSGSVIQNCYNSTLGGGVYNRGTFTMNTGSIIQNCTSSGGGGVVNAGTFDMNGTALVSGNSAADGGGVYNTGGAITMAGGTISGNKATTGSGGGVFISSASGGTFTMSGTAEISGNTAATNGGGVMNWNTFNMTGGKITGGNSAQSGGGMYSAGSGTFTMSAGEISGNTATQNGGGVYNTGSGPFNMSGGKITGANTATQGGGGVYSNGTFTMSGTAEISGNSAHQGGGILNYGNATFTMTDGVISGNTATQNGGGVCNGNTTGSSPIFNMNGGEISGNDASFGAGVSSSFGTFTMNDGKISGNTATGSNGGGGVYNNFTATFIMNGGEITGGNTALIGGGVMNWGPFTMNSTAEISGNTATQNGGGVYNAGSSAIFTMSGTAVVSDNTATDSGGGVWSSGTFDMQGGKITGANTAQYGGGVLNNFGGTITMNGGEISSNIASRHGGGVYSYGTFDMSGTAKISGNTATADGGGVNNNNNGTFTMTDGEISGNTAGVGGGVVNFDTFDMQGGNITGGNTADYGGGVYNGSTFTMSAGTISGNTADYGGGGVLNTSGGAFNMSGTAKISGNAASSNGGGVYNNNGTFDMSGTAEISGNTAAVDGGGIYTTDTATYGNLNIAATVTFSGNSASAFYLPPPNPFVTYPTILTSSSSLAAPYDHPLNNYDINRAMYIVTVYYEDELGAPIGSPTSATYTVANGNTFSLTAAQIPDITGYTLSDWKIGMGALEGNTTVSVAAITGNTDIHLVYSFAVTEKFVDVSSASPIDSVGLPDSIVPAIGGSYTPATGTPPASHTVSGDMYNYLGYTVGSYSAGDTLMSGAPSGLTVSGPETVYYVYTKALPSIKVEKYDHDGMTLLPGAEFKLEKLTDTIANGGVVDAFFSAQTLTATSGTAIFSNLPAGIYQVTETKAPAGYALLIEPFEVVIPYTITLPTGLMPTDTSYLYAVKSGGDVTYYYYDVTYKVSDQAAITMPAAGVNNTRLPYMLAGGALVLATVCAGTILLIKRRRRKYQAKHAA